jgi:Predicted Fe-S oxidoreductases
LYISKQSIINKIEFFDSPANGDPSFFHKFLYEINIMNSDAIDVYTKVTLKRLVQKALRKIFCTIFPTPPAKLDPVSRKVIVPRIETYLANGCNLKCHLCSHFNPKRKGIVPADDLALWFNHWKEKLLPETVALLGGEPLLNKDIARILRTVRECWPKAKIEIVSNGLLLTNLTEADIDEIKKTKAYFVISQHTTDPVLVEKIVRGFERLKMARIPFEVRPSIREWLKYHQIGPDGEPFPYQSDPDKAWKNCIPKECVALWDNQLYKCSLLANAQQAHSEGVIGDAWVSVLTYKPLTLESTSEEIVRHLSGQGVKECCICPEEYELVQIG